MTYVQCSNNVDNAPCSECTNTSSLGLKPVLSCNLDLQALTRANPLPCPYLTQCKAVHLGRTSFPAGAEYGCPLLEPVKSRTLDRHLLYNINHHTSPVHLSMSGKYYDTINFLVTELATTNTVLSLAMKTWFPCGLDFWSHSGMESVLTGIYRKCMAWKALLHSSQIPFSPLTWALYLTSCRMYCP